MQVFDFELNPEEIKKIENANHTNYSPPPSPPPRSPPGAPEVVAPYVQRMSLHSVHANLKSTTQAPITGLPDQPYEQFFSTHAVHRSTTPAPETPPPADTPYNQYFRVKVRTEPPVSEPAAPPETPETQQGGVHAAAAEAAHRTTTESPRGQPQMRYTNTDLPWQTQNKIALPQTTHHGGANSKFYPFPPATALTSYLATPIYHTQRMFELGKNHAKAGAHTLMSLFGVQH